MSLNWTCANVIRRPTVIVGLVLQQAIAMFVLKSGAGFSIFKWIAFLAADFLEQGQVGAEFFFDAEVITKHWFFVNTVRCPLGNIGEFHLRLTFASS